MRKLFNFDNICGGCEECHIGCALSKVVFSLVVRIVRKERSKERIRKLFNFDNIPGGCEDCRVGCALSKSVYLVTQVVRKGGSGKRMKKLYVYEDICNGCANCQMWCALAIKGEFNRAYAKIEVARDGVDGRFNIPMVNCTGAGCDIRNEKGDPLCVEMCPTGAIVYTDAEDAYKKRIELQQSREVQPLFKMIAPWKWPFPWREWPKGGA